MLPSITSQAAHGKVTSGALLGERSAAGRCVITTGIRMQH
jgi:hypothetical protein